MKREISGVDYRYGFPIVSASNIYEIVEQLGIKPLARITDPQDLKEYSKKDLSEGEKKRD